jgi:hypothetical protein
LYVPRIGVDTAQQVMGMAIARAGARKKPYTVIVDTRAEALQLRAEIEACCRDEGPGKMAAAFKQPASGRRKPVRDKLLIEASFHAVNRGVQVKANQRDDDSTRLARLDPQTTKLYVLGHGTTGGDGVYVKTGPQSVARVSSEALASKLRDGGLPHNHEDVRLILCHGSEEPVDGGPSGQSTGQRVANALGKAGFDKVTVSAYPGELLRYPRPFGDGRLHKAVLPDPDSGKPVIASQARKSFVPDDPAETPAAELSGPRISS